ncbi:MAG TPA: ATP-binding cassette domain-containing protein [Solirubrobacteraceae bacterium]|jgi:putative ABC transport system ATP-binding protein|nr:ATP-binding cassette domain-containing protein [Solirubrobacteraceae bacterium]
MSLLALEHVSKHYREGQRERTALTDVDLEVRAGELVVVYGLRRSGRTTLLRIAAGIETPDAGSVRFAGEELARARRAVLGEGIGYVRKALRASEEDGVLEQVVAPLLARGVSVEHARKAAWAALERAGAERCAAVAVGELSAGESVRVALARALVLSPALLVADEPAAAVGLSERDGILAQLREFTRDGTAVLSSTAEPSEMAGAHRALTLGEGRLRGPSTPQLAPVVALRRSV